MSHTPTPWKATSPSKTKFEEHIWTDEGYGSVLIASCSGMNRRENAEFIARAVNSHQAMKEALELLLHEPMAERAVDKAKQALTLANGGQGNNPTQDLINQVRHLHD